MKTAILLLSFGEPETATPETVAPFLERIFLANARLDPSSDPGRVRARVRAMTERRLPDLIADYQRIGGSPLNRQAARQAEALAAALERRGHADVVVLTGMQFTDPSIGAAAERARRLGADRLMALPVYPLCGPSTTVAALAGLADAVDAMGWTVPVTEVMGWHAHPAYTELRAAGVRALCGARGLDLADPATRLVFSAHGTPLRYLEEGSRYDRYVDDHCRRLAAALGVGDYVLGFQNHGNRPGVAWTQPDIDRAIEGLDARRIVVVPVSFMHEQSETLAELDLGLRARAEALGLEFHRAPVPHDDPAFIDFLADLLTPLLGDSPPAQAGYRPCACRPVAGALCLNREPSLIAGEPTWAGPTPPSSSPSS